MSATDFAGGMSHIVKVSKRDAVTHLWLPEYIAALPSISYNFHVLMGEGVFVFVGEGLV